MNRMTPEAQARIQIDQLLQAAGWHVCHLADANIHSTTGVATREFPLNTGHGFADYQLYVNGKACGVIEAKKEGATLKGVEIQSEKYAQGLPAWRRPLPFLSSQTFRKQVTSHKAEAIGLRRVSAAFLAEATLPLVSFDDKPLLPSKEQQVRSDDEVDRHLSIIREFEVVVGSNLLRVKTLRQAVLMKNFTKPQGESNEFDRA